MGFRGDPFLNDLSSCSTKFLPSRAGFLHFFGRMTDQPRWGIYTPRMPAVATMGGSRGRSCWTCGSERARTTRIEVPCLPHTDHFSRSKGSRFYAREVRSTMHEVRNLRSITERWRTRSRATRLRPESQGYSLLRLLRDGGVLLCANGG